MKNELNWKEHPSYGPFTIQPQANFPVVEQV